MKLQRVLTFTILAVTVIKVGAQQPAVLTYTIQTKTKIAVVPAIRWKLFFEDINRAADGGLYAEMVENRIFDFPKPLTAWDYWPKCI